MKADMFLGRQVAVYRIDEFLGEGGFAFVYKARDENLDIDVALKVLKPVYAYDEVFEENFRREAHRAAKFRHPNVIAIHYAGKEDDVVFFSMDLLDRGLSELVKQGKPLDDATVVKTGMDVASALQFAHTHEGGIVHRDLKPDNILLDRHGNAVVTDFGIADAATNYTAVTGTTVYVGTPRYMSPEQARGMKVDGRSDIYSLGVTLYEMIAGDVPFTGGDWFELGRAHIEQDPPPPSERNPSIDRELERIILKCLAKSPDDRYRSAAELRAELSRLYGETQQTALLPVSPETGLPTPPEVRKRRTARKSGQSRASSRGGGSNTRKGRGALWTSLGALIVLTGGLAAYSQDVGRIRGQMEARVPALANVPLLGSGHVYARSPEYEIIEGGADVGGDIEIAFTGPIDPTTANRNTVALARPDGSPVPAQVTAIGSRRIRVTPADSLDFETEYRLELGEGLLASDGAPIRGSPYGPPGAGFTLTTRLAPPDHEPPVLAASSPDRDASNVAPDVDLSLTFNEPLDPSSVDTAAVRLLDGRGEPLPLELFCCQGGRTVQLEPGTALRPGSQYAIMLTGGIRDRAGNAARPDSFSFSTAARRPEPVLPARISVAVLPEIARSHVRILIDGDSVGIGTVEGHQVAGGRQHTIQLLGGSEFGSHTLQLYNQRHSTGSGENLTVRPEVPGFGTININTNPSGGRVFLDGQELGTTPLAGYPIREGSYRLEIRPSARDAQTYGSAFVEFELGAWEWDKALGVIQLPER